MSKLQLYDRALLSKAQQLTESCAFTFLLVEEIFPKATKKFIRYHTQLLNNMRENFTPKHVVKVLEYLFARMQNFYPECQQVLTEQAGKFIGARDVEAFVKGIRTGERLSKVAEFLYLAKPVITTAILSEAMKFEFDDIPERFNEMLLLSLQPFILCPEFLSNGHRVLNNPSVSAEFLTRLANELDRVKVMSPAQLRIAACLAEKGFLDHRKTAKMDRSAQLISSSAASRALGKPFTGKHASLESLVDTVLLVASKPALSPTDESALLEPVLKRITELPIAHSIRVFEQYSVEESRDSVTQSLLDALTAKVQTCESAEVTVRFLKAASAIQWGSPALVIPIVQSAAHSFLTMRLEDKLSFMSTLGQFTYRDAGIWSLIADYFTSSRTLLQENGAAMLHSLHQARYLNIRTWSGVVLKYLPTLIHHPANLTGLELRKVMLALFPHDVYMLTQNVRDSLVTMQSAATKNDFHSYLLYNWLEVRPEGVQLGSREQHLHLAKEIAKKQVVQPLSPWIREVIGDTNIAPEPLFLGSGFYLPYYIPRLRAGLWPSTRAFSVPDRELTGDFALLSESAHAVKCTLKIVPNRRITDLKSAQEWCQAEGLIIPK